ncbi:NTP transferase domain-containing protein, partial [Brucella melitensis]|uniref:NTP transferase domain-containing protein n=1 Tax=Brucella melitensis TaxID=29459 RepID=UPI003B67A7CC
LLQWTLRSLLDGGIRRVTVVVAPNAVFAPVTLLHDARVTLVTNPDPDRGMLSSIQGGLESAAGDPILVLPADMPFVRSR